MEWTCTGSYRRHRPPLDPLFVSYRPPPALPLPLFYSILLPHFPFLLSTVLFSSPLLSSIPVNVFTLFQFALMHEGEDEDGDGERDGDEVGRAIIVSTTNNSIPILLHPHPCNPMSIPVLVLSFLFRLLLLFLKVPMRYDMLEENCC